MDEINKLYDQIKQQQIEVLSSQEPQPRLSQVFDLQSSIVQDYFRVPSSPKHSIQAHEREATALCFDHRGQMIATGGVDGYVRVWDPESGKSLQQHNFKFSVSSLAFSPDNEFLCGSAVSKQIRLWRIKTERQHHQFSGHVDLINSMKFSNVDKLLITGSSDRTI